uniref:LYR motif containing 4 n=2 Tax=Boreoeutheria TaxID=1437010 RepID=A0A9L0K1D8_EQUAS
MAASSRAQVLDLYRAMLRESKHFSAYNYRSTLANCIRLTSLSLRLRRSPGPSEPGPATTGSHGPPSASILCLGWGLPTDHEWPLPSA